MIIWWDDNGYLIAVFSDDIKLSLVVVCVSVNAISLRIVYDTNDDDDSSTLLLDTAVTLVIVISDTFKPPPIDSAIAFANIWPFSANFCGVSKSAAFRPLNWWEMLISTINDECIDGDDVGCDDGDDGCDDGCADGCDVGGL